jgi:hypothetical protein
MATPKSVQWRRVTRYTTSPGIAAAAINEPNLQGRSGLHHRSGDTRYQSPRLVVGQKGLCHTSFSHSSNMMLSAIAFHL